jgi:uncharacterized protein (TIGR03067 family)
VKRFVLGLLLALAAGCGQPLPWERPAPARKPAPQRPPEPDPPVQAAPDWAAGLSEEVRQAMEDLQGTWVVTRARRNDKVDAALAQATVTLTGNYFTSRSDRTVTAAGTWTVDPTRTPPTLELNYTEGAEKGQKVAGIYSRDGNVWIVIYSAPGQPPPASFKQASEPGWTFLTLKRTE